MTDIDTEVRNQMRRTLQHEFVRMEDDFDKTRNQRDELVSKLMDVAKGVTLIDKEGNTREDTDTGLRIVTTALKALSDVEKSHNSAISLKLRQGEQEIASSAAAKDRIAIILKATAPGRIEESIDEGVMQDTLSKLFDGEIKEFELKSSPADLSD